MFMPANSPAHCGTGLEKLRCRFTVCPRFVADINDASWVSEDAALIHHMPNYVEDAVPVVS